MANEHISDASGSERSLPDTGLTVPEQFRAIAAAIPDRLAVTDGQTSLTYRLLDNKSNQVAHALLQSKSPARHPVALLFDHSADMLVAILGVLKSGHPYLPLDPNQPVASQLDTIASLSPQILLYHSPTEPRAQEFTQAAHATLTPINLSTLDPELSEEAPQVNILSDSIAVYLHTSGSTGKSKILQRSHQVLLSTIDTRAEPLRLTSDDRVPLLIRYTFGASRTIIFEALLSGVCLLVYDIRKQGLGPMTDWMRNKRATVTLMVTSVLRQWMQSIDGRADLPSLRLVRIGGERVMADDVRQFHSLFNEGNQLSVGLGISEVGAVTYYVFDHNEEVSDEAMPLGYAVPGRDILLLDDDGQPLTGPGTGEIVVRINADSVTSGYVGNPELSATRFRPDPEDDSSLLYFTGDIGWLRADGCLMFGGRKDFQIKIRGMQVQLDEVEVHLHLLPGVKHAAAASYEPVSGHTQLVAYLEPVNPHTEPVEDSRLRSALVSQLPAHMIPSRFVWMSPLPRLPSGKLDRQSLPAPGHKRPSLTNPYAPPTDDLEQQLVTIWESLLDISPIGIDDKFFDLGGHSLLASQVVVDIEREIGQTLSMARLSQAPTIRRLAALLSEPEVESRLPSLIPIQAQGNQRPLYCIHPRGGLVGLYYHLARNLGMDQPVYGLQALGLDGISQPHKSMQEMAAYYIQEIQTIQPHGPYDLCGFSLGGLIAHEMACQLEEAGLPVGTLIVLDTLSPLTWPGQIRKYVRTAGESVSTVVHTGLRGLRHVLALLQETPVYGWPSALVHQFQHLRKIRREQIANAAGVVDPFNQPHWTPERRVLWANRLIMNTYAPKCFSGQIVMFQAANEWNGRQTPQEFFEGMSEGGVRVIEIQGSHRGIMEEPLVQELAAGIRAVLSESRRSNDSDSH